MNSQDSLSIICSFLQPLELCRLRSVGKHYESTVSLFLMKKYDTVSIEHLSCPQCGNLCENDEITDPSFYDILYGNTSRIESQRYSDISYFSNEEYKIRTQLRCEDCDNYEIEDPKNGFVMFRYRGSRSYKLVVNRSNLICPWAFLTYTYNENILYWNECRAIISPSDMPSSLMCAYNDSDDGMSDGDIDYIDDMDDDMDDDIDDDENYEYF